MSDNAVIYARFSSAKQDEQSIEGQLRECYAYAERHGYAVVNEYVDRALSGTSAETRPAFQQMIADSAKKQFSYVLVWKLDRFARNRYDSVVYKRRLRQNGVMVVSVTEGVGAGSESQIVEAILEAVAEEYSHQLSQNVRRGMNESAMKANFCGGPIPLGYRIENKKYVLEPEEARLVKLIFEQYAAGKGKKQIIDDLTAAGYRSRAGKPLTINSVTNMLKNRKYLGEYSYNQSQVVVPGGCPAIIDEKLFNRVQAISAKNKRARGHSYAEVEYLLYGKLFCGYCGARMVGESGKNRHGMIYNYYACATRKKEHNCRKANEKKGFLEWYIVEQTVEYILTPARIDYISRRVVEEYEKEFSDSRLAELEKRLAKIDREFDKLTDRLIATENPSVVAKINEKAAALELQKTDAQIDLARLRTLSKVRMTEDDIKKWLRSFCQGDPLDEAYQRRIIDAFVNCIYLYDHKLVIYYNIRDGEQLSVIDPDPSPGSDDNQDGSPFHAKSELIPIGEGFGFVLYFEKQLR